MIKYLLLPFSLLLTFFFASAQLEFLNDPLDYDSLIVEMDPPCLENLGPDDLFEAFDCVFDSLANSGYVRGLSAAVKLADGSVWKRAAGIAEAVPDTVPLTTEHIINMGSITKSFVSTTLLLMMEDGLLDLDDSIGMYLDPYPNIPGHATIRQLLSHRSGIRDIFYHPDAMNVFNNCAYPDSIWVMDTVLYNLVLEPNWPVDFKYEYSNTNYLLAGRIIEKLTNQPWYSVIRERILDPLELTHTFAFPFESVDDQLLAHLFVYNVGVMMDLQGSGIPFEGIASLVSSAGCLFSTPEDLVRFTEQLHGGFILQAETMEEMYTTTAASAWLDYGLGIYSKTFLGKDCWGHDGYLGYRSVSFYIPEDSLTIAVQQNDDEYKNTPEKTLKALLKSYIKIKTATEEAIMAARFKVYPNPTNNKFVIELPEGAIYSFPLPFSIIDINGITIKNLDIQQNKTEINVGEMPKGIYVLKSAFFTEKLLIN